jgi:hypothetical protein
MFARGQIVFKVPDYRRFHKVNYQTCQDRPQPYDYAWMVGSEGEFYKSHPDEGETTVKDSGHTKEFHGAWSDALQAALDNVNRQAQVVADIVKSEISKYNKKSQNIRPNLE